MTVLLMMLPFGLSAKTVISDSDLEAVEAEQGVTITFSNITVGGTAALSVASWSDGDGFSSYTGSGSLGINAVTIGGNLTTINGPAVIDVGTSGSVTMVNVVMPTVTLGTANIDATLKLSDNQNLSGGERLGLLGVRGFSTQMTGNIGVYAH